MINGYLEPATTESTGKARWFAFHLVDTLGLWLFNVNNEVSRVFAERMAHSVSLSFTGSYKYTNKMQRICYMYKIEPRHEISNNVVCATSKASEQPAHPRSLIRAFASRLNII